MTTRRTVLAGMAAITAASFGDATAGREVKDNKRMVYGLSQDNPDKLSYGYKNLDGDTNKIDSPDLSQDEGRKVRGPGIGWLTYGRPVNPDHVPTRILREGPHRFMPDVLWPYLVPTISDSVKNIIEKFEPDVHQFLPVDIIWKNGSLAGRRYVLVICRRLDSIHRGLSTMDFVPPLWRTGPNQRMVFDRSKIGDAHLWRDKHLLTSAAFASNDLGEALRDAGVTGISLKQFEEA